MNQMFAYDYSAVANVAADRLLGNITPGNTLLESLDAAAVLSWLGTTASGNSALYVGLDDVTVANTSSPSSLLVPTGGSDYGNKTIVSPVTGDVIRWDAFGEFSTMAASAGSLNLQFVIGATQAAGASPPVSIDNVAAKFWRFRGVAVLTAGGASGTGRGYASLVYYDPTAAEFKIELTNSTSFSVDASADLSIDIQATWSVSDPGNTITCHNTVIERLNPK